MRLRSLLFLVPALLLAPAALAAPAPSSEDGVYRTPPPAIADLLTAPRLPRGAPNTSPDGAWLAVSDLRSLIPISVLAEPVLKLAGLEVLPEMWASRNGLKNAAAGLTFYKVADGSQVRAKLPQDVQLGPVRWSNKGDRVACIAFAKGGSDLWVVDAATGNARRLEGVKVHSINTILDWSNDDTAIFTALVVGDSKNLPDVSRGAEERGPRHAAAHVA